jgi:hypothetical protein
MDVIISTIMAAMDVLYIVPLAVSMDIVIQHAIANHLGGGHFERAVLPLINIILDCSALHI